MMVACWQSWNMFLEWVLTRLFTNHVVFDGIKFSFDSIYEAQWGLKHKDDLKFCTPTMCVIVNV
jgi:hypothetical protein